MRYDRVKDPNLERLQQSVIRGLESVENNFMFGKPTSIKAKDYNPKFGELVLFNRKDNAITFRLPKLTKKDIGKVISFADVTGGSEVITLHAVDTDTIAGSNDQNISAYGLVKLVAVTENLWVVG